MLSLQQQTRIAYKEQHTPATLKQDAVGDVWVGITTDQQRKINHSILYKSKKSSNFARDFLR